MANILKIDRTANSITLGTTGTTINIASHTASRLLGLDASKDLESLTDIIVVGKLTAGSFASPLDVTNTREYGFEIHYSGNNYNATAIRARAHAVTTDTFAQFQGGLFQAANNDNINVGVLNGLVAEAIGKATVNAATITMMRGALVGAEWSAKDTVTDLRTLHVRTHTRDAATEGYVSNTGYGIYIENEAVGGNGQALDAGIYFKGTNLSAGNKAFTYGLDFSGATIATADIKLSNAATISNVTSGYLDYSVGTAHRFNMSTANTDVRLEFIGTTNSGLMAWMEDEDAFYFADKVGIGISTPHSTDTVLHVYAGSSGVTVPWSGRHDLIVEGDDTTGISILTPDDKVGSLVWGSPSDSNHAYIDCEQALNGMFIGAGGVQTMALVSGKVGILVTDPHSALEVAGAISSATATITESTANLDVSGINVLFVNPGAATTITGFANGVAGQVLFISAIANGQDITMVHNSGTQKVFLHTGGSETLSSEFGGWTLTCDGSNWYDTEHSKHV